MTHAELFVRTGHALLTLPIAPLDTLLGGSIFGHVGKWCIVGLDPVYIDGWEHYTRFVRVNAYKDPGKSIRAQRGWRRAKESRCEEGTQLPVFSHPFSPDERYVGRLENHDVYVRDNGQIVCRWGSAAWEYTLGRPNAECGTLIGRAAQFARERGLL